MHMVTMYVGVEGTQRKYKNRGKPFYVYWQFTYEYAYINVYKVSFSR